LTSSTSNSPPEQRGTADVAVEERNGSIPDQAWCSSAVLALAAIAHAAGTSLSPEFLHRKYALGLSEPSPSLLARIASEHGFRASAQQMNLEAIISSIGPYPMMAQLKSGGWVVLAGVKPEDGRHSFAVLDPSASAASITYLDDEIWQSLWSGYVVIARRRFVSDDMEIEFGFRWFLQETWRQKSAFRDVAAASFILTLLALGSPLFTQLVIDKVLMHENQSTLIVLTVGVLFVLLFETAFTFLRQFLLLGATNKVDMRLTRRAFTHLLSLPIQFFETSSAGVVMRNMQQLEKIRAFFTGQLFFTILECAGLLVFGPLLFLYSPMLASVVIGFSVAMALVVVALIKPFQARLNRLYAAEGRRQSILVETIHGMRTVKALAIEPMKIREWNERSANSILTGFEVMKISIAAQALTQILERSMMVAVIALGALSIFDHAMTVGTLIAFQMISGRVTGPLVQVIGLVHQYQETLLSVRMLGEIMNHPTEGKKGGGLRPDLQGGISFERVSFRYPGASANALQDVSLRIQKGQVIGVVGRSGSGKTTLTRLIQAMYRVSDGVVRLDGIDIREIDLAHLRSSIGVVLQENFMFRGTVRENIAASRPNASIRDIILAAQAAGADEFIERLPQGYDTLLEENASNLSGGQKQRLSIARAILAEPKLLILDEAASALDPESEAIFIRNLAQIARGKTVLMVSHRLSTLVQSDAIMVFDRGHLADVGKHSELLERCEPYEQLWRQQMGML
jgi:subfamily B ATP-binding cassette protein HlyB/CyaB